MILTLLFGPVLDYCCVCIVHWLLLFSRLMILTYNNAPTVTVGCVSGGWEVSRWRCSHQYNIHSKMLGGICAHIVVGVLI
jgi:hypothetical protein